LNTNKSPSPDVFFRIRKFSPRINHFRVFFLSVSLVVIFTFPATFFEPALAAPRSTPGFIDPPTVTLGVPATALIGSAAVSFTVTFDNNDLEAGYGPFLELQIPRTGADGAGAAVDDGLGTTTISATYMGGSIPPGDFYRTTFNAGGTATDPIVRDGSGNFITVSGTPGDELVDIRLPFGSFSADQPPAVIQMTVNLSNLADLGYPLTIRARGGYEFGYTPLDDWCCGDAASATLSGYTSASVTPTLLTLSKTYIGPANTSAETATGPNFARQYTVSADIPTGQTITDLTLTDLLPNNMQYLSIVSATPGGYIVDDHPTLGAAQNPPNNDLVVRWPTVTGGAGANDAAVTFSFFVPRDNANGLSVIDPAAGNAVSSCNNARASGLWTPIDVRDPAQVTTTDPDGCEHTLIDRSLAIQKSVANITDGVNSPGDVMNYTLEFQISDFFAFDQVLVTDVLSDGQHFDPSFVPTLAVEGNGYSLGTTNFNSANYSVDLSKIDLADGPPPQPENLATDGTTKLLFRVSDEIITRGQNGRMIGGCVDPVGGSPHPDCSHNDGGTTAVINFHSIIQDNFTDNYPSGDWSVDQGDTFRDDVSVAGRLLNTGTFVPGGSVTDDAEAGFAIPTGALSKRIYAINGSTSFASPPRIAPGDTVTYRITYVMPTSDEEILAFADYLPLPIFFVADPDANDYNTLSPPGAHNDGPVWGFDAVGQSGQPTVIPAAGRANFGPSDTFYTYSGKFPALSANVANNRLDFDYGNYDNPANLSRTVDILFSVVVATEPFADQMYLTNQVHAVEGSTNAGPVASDSIVQLILTEPVLRSTKGVVWTSNPSNVFNPANLGPEGVVFQPPGSAPRWTGTINSSGLAARPINSDVRDVDAGDTVTFAITVENTGTSLKGAFDIRIADVLQPEYQIPVTGLNLQVYYGNRTGPIAYRGLTTGCLAVGNDDLCGKELFQAGIELVDPVGTGVCQAHDPNLGNNVILITYDLQIRTIVAPGNVINTETLLHYAGDEGGPNHVPIPSPYTDKATVTISGAPAKYIVNTSEPDTVFSGVEQVTIGEIIRYRIVARIPESTMVNYQLTDLLPNGLLFLDDGTARIGLISNRGIVSAGRNSIPAIPVECDLVGTAADATTPAMLPCSLDDWNIGSTDSTTDDPDVYASGTDIYFKLGDLRNPDLDDDGEFAVIEFNALVHNQITDQNNSGDTRDNSVRTFAGVPSSQFGNDSPAVSVRIVEPILTLNKTHSALGTTVDAGDVVTYTATITNDGNAPTNSTATAFDVDFTDTPPAAYLTLNLASITATTNGGVTVVFNGSSGNTVHFTVGSMPVGSQVILTYQVTVTNNVNPGQAIANTGAVLWTSLPGPHGTGDHTPGAPGTGTGERDGSNGPTGNPNHYDRQAVATLNIRAPIFSKTLQHTSAGHTAGNALAIGEVATFGLMVTLPEGTTPSLQLLDDLPNGLAYVPGSMQLVTQTNPPANCGNLAAGFNGTVPLPALTISPPSGGSGANLTFDFTAITVAADNVSNNNSFLVCFDAVLLDETGNQASSPPLTNTGSLIVGLNTFIGSQNVTVVEPVLRIAKSVDDPNPAPGQVVTFTVIVDHAGSSTATAFDAVIFDTLPSDLTLVLSSVGATASGGLTGVANASTGNQVYFSVSSFPIGGSLTLTFRATVNAAFGTTVNNLANVTWTSLPGGDANERTGADGVGGLLNDYAARSNAPLITNRNLTKTLVGDSFPAPVTTLPDVAIGEILTYELVLTVPPASTGTYTVADTLDPGLAFVDCADITAGAGLASSKVNLHAAGNCNDGTGSGNNPLISNSGATVSFDFGTVTNADSVNPESITIRYQAVVLDIAANVRGVSLSNSATMQWATGHITRQTPPVRIIESDLGLEKSVDHPMAAPGMPLIYRVRIYHTGNSQLDAYDVTINDILPEGVAYVPGSLSFVTGSGTPPNLLDDTGIDPGTGHPIIHAVWNTLALGQQSTIEFIADFGDNLPKTKIVNTAGAEWTSLPGSVPAPPATYLSIYNQQFSHERRYDPLNPADRYRVTSAVTVTALSLPDTGFAPGRVTSLPPQTSNKRYAYLGGLLLEIPKLNQNLPVVGVPITNNGWDLTWLWDQAGYLTGTAYPGSAGNSVITAHVYLSNGLPGPFVNLGTLRWGDRIILLGGGQRFIYEVRENTRVLPTDITPFRHEENPWLTLITCQDYNWFSNSYRYRTVVRAVLIAVEAGS
jgi:LPXTG-site transpeptidase (sortase) family protein